jgi:hypothetical protein
MAWTSSTFLSPAIAIIQCGLADRTNHSIFPSSLAVDTYHGGRYKILGTVREAATPIDVPVVRKVRLHRKIDGMMIRQTWSAADGTYSFSDIASQLYYVVSFDHLANYNAVVKDAITPEAM